MTRETQEKQLLQKLSTGHLDGIVGRDADMGGTIHRAIIIDGIPYLVTFPITIGMTEEETVVQYEFRTEEGKLWFLRNHGWRMQDPDVIQYSRTYRRPTNP